MSSVVDFVKPWGWGDQPFFSEANLALLEDLVLVETAVVVDGEGRFICPRPWGCLFGVDCFPNAGSELATALVRCGYGIVQHLVGSWGRLHWLMLG